MNTNMQPSEQQVSKFKIYSIGIVGENKSLTGDIIEVTPKEELPMLDGEITADQTLVSASGKDSTGGEYTSKVSTGSTVQAKWLRLATSNRLTAPNVRRGEEVIIYQMADTDKYYWVTMLEDLKLRKLETVVYAFSATKEEGADPAHDNCYYMEVSSHKQIVTLHTSMANGEYCSYDVQINAKDGYITLQDSIGNEIRLDSRKLHLYMKNNAGSIVEINRDVANITTPNEINFKTNKVGFTCNEMNIKAGKYKANAGQYGVSGATTFDGSTFLVNSDTIDLG
jgi:hypothetical protein